MISTTQTTLVTIQLMIAIVLARGLNRRNERGVATNWVSEMVNAKMHKGMNIQSPGSLEAK